MQISFHLNSSCLCLFYIRVQGIPTRYIGPINEALVLVQARCGKKVAFMSTFQIHN